jgi:hypothetical protein
MCASEQHTEEWRVCSDFPAYEVSDQGHIRRRGRCIVLITWSKYQTLHLRRDGRTFTVVLHRLVAKAFGGLPEGLEINRRHRCAATHAENVRGARPHVHSSIYKGVSWSARRALWYASIRLNGKTRSLGLFASEQDAARAYNAAASAAWGRFAFLNDL